MGVGPPREIAGHQCDSRLSPKRFAHIQSLRFILEQTDIPKEGPDRGHSEITLGKSMLQETVSHYEIERKIG